jgi:hypothetical protein
VMKSIETDGVALASAVVKNAPGGAIVGEVAADFGHGPPGQAPQDSGPPGAGGPFGGDERRGAVGDPC